MLIWTSLYIDNKEANGELGLRTPRFKAHAILVTALVQIIAIYLRIMRR